MLDIQKMNNRFYTVGGMVIVFGVQGYMGIAVDPSMIFVPIFLGIAITTSYSIHIFNFSRR